jgi:hypothetical protein
MSASVGQLQKLREMSFRKIRVGGGREISQLDERFFDAGSVEMTDAKLPFENCKGSQHS